MKIQRVMKLKQTLAAGITALALATTMAACSDDGDNDTSSSDSSSETDNQVDDQPDDQTDNESGNDETADDAADTEAGAGGETSVKVEGKDLSGLDLDSVTCVKQGGKITVGSAAIGGQEGLGVVMTDEEQPKVEALSIMVDDAALAVASSAGGNVGSAEVAVDGDTYTITGEATGANVSDPTAGMITKKFEIKVSCD